MIKVGDIFVGYVAFEVTSVVYEGDRIHGYARGVESLATYPFDNDTGYVRFVASPHKELQHYTAFEYQLLQATEGTHAN